jgi:hypothetical protein
LIYRESWENYSSFFLSKKVFRCHSCKPATDKQMPSERNPSQAMLELVLLFRFCVSSSLDKNAVSELLQQLSQKLCLPLRDIADGMNYLSRR